jgi:hypothetical protein
MADVLDSGWFWGIFGILASIPIGWFFGWYFFKRGQQRGHLMATQRTTVFIHDALATLPRLKVSWDDQRIPNFSATLLYIWNAGNVTIRETDLDPLPEYRLRVEITDPEATILDIARGTITAPESHLSLTPHPDGKRADITFRYLEPNQGATFAIYHTLPRPGALRLQGKLIDVPVSTWDIDDEFVYRTRVQRRTWMPIILTIITFFGMLPPVIVAVSVVDWPTSLRFAIIGTAMLVTLIVPPLTRFLFDNAPPIPGPLLTVPPEPEDD